MGFNNRKDITYNKGLTMKEVTFNVVSKGAFLDGYDPKDVKKLVTARFNLNNESFDRFFAKPGTVVKSALDLDTARRYGQTLRQMGVDVILERIESEGTGGSNPLPTETVMQSQNTLIESSSPPSPATVYKRTKTTAGVLAIVAGGLGIHKFYLGKHWQGVLYLAFCWTFIPSIIAIFDGIYYLTRNSTDFSTKYN